MQHQIWVLFDALGTAIGSAGGVHVASGDGCGRLLKAAERFDPEQLIMVVPAEAILAEGVGESNYQARVVVCRCMLLWLDVDVVVCCGDVVGFNDLY